jgi:hypothetical protein
MPVLATAASWLERSRWKTDSASLRRVPRADGVDGWAFEVRLRPALYPGVTLEHPFPNWSRWHALVVTIDSDDVEPLRLILKIVDAAHNNETDDRFHRAIDVRPGKQVVRIELADVAAAPRGRRLDLTRIDYLQIFAVRLPHSATFYISDIRLQ